MITTTTQNMYLDMYLIHDTFIPVCLIIAQVGFCLIYDLVVYLLYTIC